MSRLNFSVDAFEAYHGPERRPIRDLLAPANVKGSVAVFVVLLLGFPTVIFWFLF